MTDAERREAARKFVNKWNGKGNEDQDSQKYWFDFLNNIVGIDNVTDRVVFEKKVFVDGNPKKIDVYIPETHTLIEQKSIGKQLDKKIINSGDIALTPYEQAKRYNDNLPYDEKARWIVTSNFSEIWIYDMNLPIPTPVKVQLTELQTKFSMFDFMIDKEQTKLSQEMEVSVKAGEFVGLIYDALLKQYINPNSEETLKSLNMLCVRIVFCLYAEDAHIFGNNGHMFHDYLNKFETKDLRKALIELFKILDTPEDKRDPYDTSELSKFPYVNGGLFANEDIEIPNFTEEIRSILLAKASEEFDWSMISPTIFGAVFESTLNPDTRRSGGMHYTSIENIHKVIDPLFLDDLKQELNEIKTIQVIKTRNNKLKNFQEKLSNLTWLDPACGSGNFLTETYLSIRKLENEVIKTLKGGQISLLTDELTNPIKVSIDQFYGIEINDFAVTVAKTALWIAESQMMKETEDILLMQLDFLPLKTNAHIVEQNALRINWDSIVSKDKLSYIMGNPPFIGTKWMSKEQKVDTKTILGEIKNFGTLDYVCCWYFLASKYIKGTNIECAFVSTNSICQGEQVANLWEPMTENGVVINFAYRTFIWDSEANDKAHVHCVIIGFSCNNNAKNKYIFDGKEKRIVSRINPYLVEADSVFVRSCKNPLCNVPQMYIGIDYKDDGNYVMEEDEKNEFLKICPEAKELIRPYMSGKDFIQRKPRYCLWFKNADPSLINRLNPVKERIKRVQEFREKCDSPDTQKFAKTPMAPTRYRYYNTDWNTDAIALPMVSSQNRRYIPIDVLKKEVIASGKLLLIPDMTNYHFGVLTSNVHMAWMRTVAGRLKSDYSYANSLVYNTFPWPSPTDDQKAKIEESAKGILIARALYPDSSLADLYNPLTMPSELQKAHIANDRAVMQAYGFDVKNMSEADCVAELMKMYQEMLSK